MNMFKRGGSQTGPFFVAIESVKVLVFISFIRRLIGILQEEASLLF